MIKTDISKELKQAKAKLGITEKFLMFSTGLSKSTINNYVNGSGVRPNEAAAIAHAVDDYETSNDIAAQFFGIFKMLDGEKFKHDAISVEAFAEFEDGEKKQAFAKYHVRKLLASSSLTASEAKDLKSATGDFLDSLLMDYKLLALICNALDVNPMEIYKERTHYYIKAGYIQPERN